MGRLFAVLAVILCLPLHIVIAAAIFLGDRGPVFYLSRRMGKGGRPFTMFKYRSMRAGCVGRIDDGFKTVVASRDPRLTAIGRILRCGFDEIPQLLNVIRGEMAWIGPRPDELWMLPHYGPAIRERVSVTPGITGLAQVCGSRDLTVPEAYALEIWAARRRTVALTLRILVMTPLFILGWRSIARPLLNRVLANPEALEIATASRGELNRAAACS